MRLNPFFLPQSSRPSSEQLPWTVERKKAFEIEQMHWMIDHTASRLLTSEEKRQLKAGTARHFNGCRQMQKKTVCSRCPVHCFSPDDAARIRLVMKSAGWKLLLFHPVRAWRHVQIDTGRL